MHKRPEQAEFEKAIVVFAVCVHYQVGTTEDRRPINHVWYIFLTRILIVYINKYPFYQHSQHTI
mgnify:FL=1